MKGGQLCRPNATAAMFRMFLSLVRYRIVSVKSASLKENRSAETK